MRAMPPRRSTAAARPRANVQINPAFMGKLRKDFLALIKNIPLVKTYSDLQVFNDAARTFRVRLEDWFFRRFLDQAVKYDLGLSDEDKNWLNTYVRSAGGEFIHTFLGMPSRDSSDGWHKEEYFVSQFVKEAPKWKVRVQTKGQVFWKAMKEAFERIEHKDGFSIDIPTKRVVELEGFKVKLVGYEPDRLDSKGNPHYNTEWAPEALEKLRRGLRVYRANATKVLPWLIRHQLPLVVNFETTLDQGGQYERDHIEIFASSLTSSKQIEWATHMLAHEMAHHLFRNLDRAAQEFWETAISGDYKELDIRELLASWPAEKKLWTHQMAEYLAKSDPILGLQVDTLVHARATSSLEQREDFEALLASGKKTLRVPATPITGYANKNTEEAFCEAVAMLVAYGRNAVHEKIRHLLSITLAGKIHF